MEVLSNEMIRKIESMIISIDIFKEKYDRFAYTG